MDLSTNYLGFELPHPLVAGASPLVDNLDTVRRLEDAGAAMIVMHSLFEEQLAAETLAHVRATEYHEECFAEGQTLFPRADEFNLGPHEYLEQLRRIKDLVNVPVVASLNGTSEGGWLSYANLLEQTGADALELNLYELAAEPGESGATVEARQLRVVEAVRRRVRIPVAVKLSPFYTALPHFAQSLDTLGVDGLVLFNRFYQPDIDVEQLEVQRVVNLSTSSELLLRLRWLAILCGQVNAGLAVSGGVHTEADVIKAVMCGAQAVQLVSALLKHGPGHLALLRERLAGWLDDHDYESLRQMQGSMSLRRCDNPRAYERANYVRILQSW